MRAGILGQDVDVKLKASRDEIQDPRLVFADLSSLTSAVRQVPTRTDNSGDKVRDQVLDRGFDQPPAPRAKDIATIKLQLPPQLFDGLLVFLGGLIVELGGFFERGPEILRPE